jgi:hypothetical protein
LFVCFTLHSFSVIISLPPSFHKTSKNVLS